MRVMCGPRVQSGGLRLIGFVAVFVAAGAAFGQSLERKVRDALAEARLGTAHVGVSIMDVQSSAELVAFETGARGDTGKGFIPASNLKLLTSGAALCVLGPEFEFRTSFLQDGERLIIRGMGDPGLADPELLTKMQTGLDGLLDRVVGMCKDAGASGIREVVLDDRVFDREYVHPDWPREQLHNAYCAEVSGLNFHANVLNVYVEPARSQPEAPWLIVKRATKKVKEGDTELRLDRDRVEPYTFKLSGNVRFPPDNPVQVTVHESCMMLGKLIADRLVRDGLSAPGVTASTMTVRLASADEAAVDGPGTKLLTAVRTPLATVLERCNVDSDNLYAESLCKVMGHKSTGQPGSWSNGTAVVRMQIQQRLGAEFAQQVILADGSGLSRNNRVTPGVLTRWLVNLAGDSTCGEVFVKSLAEIGEGTLKKRFKNAKLRCEVRAKSGYIREVRTLSGYVTDRTTGRRMAYSVLIDNIPAGADLKCKEFHEDVVMLIDAYLAGQPARK
ncbi:MAG: D-alanyl-D-alanine carboxypeptidase/D-alanyl-D-alanine-endopeptidase [Phycisphaerales bacterium]|nr:D-alanyl-D-alanine carboxypeptidase/D-alanyl-D-alanine-endopeptidase [Phycisphaerales bacterium]